MRSDNEISADLSRLEWARRHPDDARDVLVEARDRLAQDVSDLLVERDALRAAVAKALRELAGTQR
jgi:hypothetical protein